MSTIVTSLLFSSSDYYRGLSILGTDSDLLNGQLFEPEPDSPKYNPGINFAVSYDSHYEPNLPEPVTTNVTHGAGTSVADLHMGFYFSGLQTPQGDGLVAFGTDRASVTYDHLLKVEMTPLHLAKWHELPLPDNVAGRGGAGMAWLPVSNQGLLVVIGGVQYPVDAYGPGYFNTTMVLQNNATGPEFMESVSVYDVENDTWFSQPTTGNTPPQLAGFCTVVTYEAEPNSYQIYVYGGYNGVDLYGDINPDLYILSVPSFHWTKATPPRPDPLGGRWGHVCVTPYPDQMFVIGGQGSYKDPKLTQGKIVEFLNMSSLTWQDEYNPRVWSNYTIPQVVKDVSDPSRAADDMNPTLAELFTTRYTSDSSPWYPYPPASTDGRKTKLAAVLGGTFGGVALISAVCTFWLCRRKRQIKRNRESKISTMTSTTLVDSDHLVHEWINGQHKQSVSSVAMKAGSSDYQGSDVVEIGGRAVRLVGSHCNSPSLLPPRTIPSATVEVSGESRRVEELPDTSPGPNQGFHRGIDEADRRRRGSSLHPLANSDDVSSADMTEGDSTLATQGQFTRSDTGLTRSDSPNNRGPPIENRRDLYDHVYLGGETPLSGSTTLRTNDSYLHMQAKSNDIGEYQGEALPSPQRDRAESKTETEAQNQTWPTPDRSPPPRHDSTVSSDLVLSPLDTMTSFYAQQVQGGGRTWQAAAGTESIATVNFKRPMHRRHDSSMSSGVQIIENHAVASSESSSSQSRLSQYNSIPRKPVQGAVSPSILDQEQSRT